MGHLVQVSISTLIQIRGKGFGRLQVQEPGLVSQMIWVFCREDWRPTVIKVWRTRHKWDCSWYLSSSRYFQHLRP